MKYAKDRGPVEESSDKNSLQKEEEVFQRNRKYSGYSGHLITRGYE